MRFPYSGNGTWTPDYHCGFIDAVKRFFIGYMEFRGRSSRREFWLAMLFFIPVSVLIFLIPAAGTVSGILWMLATMVPIMAISFRRLHDANRTGWWFLLGHVGTILALAMLVVIAFGLVIIEIGMIMVIPHEPPKLDFHDPNSFPGMLLTLFYVSLGMAGISLIIQAFLYSLPSKPEASASTDVLSGIPPLFPPCITLLALLYGNVPSHIKTEQ